MDIVSNQSIATQHSSAIKNCASPLGETKTVNTPEGDNAAFLGGNQTVFSEISKTRTSLQSQLTSFGSNVAKISSGLSNADKSAAKKGW